MNLDPLLLTWASQYSHFAVGTTARAALLSQFVLQPDAAPAERTVEMR